MFETLNQITWDGAWNYLVDQFLNNDFASAAGLAGIATLLWTYTRKYPAWVWTRIKRSITYTVSVYETDAMFDYLEKYLSKHKEKAYRNVELKSFWKKDEQHFKYKQFEDLFFIWKGLKLIKVYKNREKLENANSLQTLFMNSYQITGLFAKKTINKMVDKVFEEEIERRANEVDPTVHIYTNDSHSWTRHNNVVPKNLDNIVLEDKKDLLEDVDKFVAARKWYERRNISYKRGYMLYGKPGNGKTTLCMSLAKYLNRNLYMLTPNRMTDDDDLMSLFRDLSPKSVLLIEDIDAVYGAGRSTKSEEVRFSFSTLLNCLDGALSKQDIVVMFTTNHPENLDPALIREGRIDFKMEVGNPNKAGIEEYLSIFYERPDITVHDFQDNDFISMVQVQNICLKNRNNFETTVDLINDKIYKS